MYTHDSYVHVGTHLMQHRAAQTRRPQPKNSLDRQSYLTRVSSASSTEAWQHDAHVKGHGQARAS